MEQVNVEQIPMEQVEILSQQIGKEISTICDEAAQRVNNILNVYGMDAKIAISFNKLDNKQEVEKPVSKKRGRKPKKPILMKSNN